MLLEASFDPRLRLICTKVAECDTVGFHLLYKQSARNKTAEHIHKTLPDVSTKGREGSGRMGSLN